jgi:hypothetical protein
MAASAKASRIDNANNVTCRADYAKRILEPFRIGPAAHRGNVEDETVLGIVEPQAPDQILRRVGTLSHDAGDRNRRRDGIALVDRNTLTRSDPESFAPALLLDDDRERTLGRKSVLGAEPRDNERTVLTSENFVEATVRRCTPHTTRVYGYRPYVDARHDGLQPSRSVVEETGARSVPEAA